MLSSGRGVVSTRNRTPSMTFRPKRAPRLRVVQSLHMAPDEHADVTAAAQLSGESIAQFIRAAAADRAASLLPTDRPTTEEPTP